MNTLERAAQAAHEAEWEGSPPRKGTAEYAMSEKIVIAVLKAIRDPEPALVYKMEGMTDFVLPAEISGNTHEARLAEMRMAWQVGIDHLISQAEEK